MYYIYIYTVFHDKVQLCRIYIYLPIPARMPYSTLFLSGYTKVDHMYCNILTVYLHIVVLYNYSNPERQYTVHTYTVCRQCWNYNCSCFCNIRVCTQQKYHFVPVDFWQRKSALHFTTLYHLTINVVLMIFVYRGATYIQCRCCVFGCYI